jgi:hypothetical protein
MTARGVPQFEVPLFLRPPPRRLGRLGAFPSTPSQTTLNAQQQAQNYVNNLQNSFTQQGDTYTLNAAQAATGADLSGIDFTAFVKALASGDAASAAQAFDTSLVTYFASVVPEAGVAWGVELAIMSGIAALEQVGATSPCTIAGCESVFGMSACDEFDSGNPFLWASIADTLVAPALPAAPFHFNGSPDYGPSNLIDWGSYDWQPNQLPGQPLDPTKPGGPGSFEQALELAIMALWDAQASAPNICSVIQAAGQNGDILLNAGLRGAIWNMLGINAGAFIPIFLAQWNATHSTGTVVTTVPCTAASCRAAGGTWIASDSSCGSSGGVAVQCTATSPAPQRKISYTVGSGGVATLNDPLSIAFEALAQLRGLPAGSTMVLPVNSGPAIAVYHLPHPSTGGSGPSTGGGSSSSSTGSTILLLVAALAALGAGGIALYGRSHGMSFGQTVRSGWNSIRHPRGRSPRRLPRSGARR